MTLGKTFFQCLTENFSSPLIFFFSLKLPVPWEFMFIQQTLSLLEINCFKYYKYMQLQMYTKQEMVIAHCLSNIRQYQLLILLRVVRKQNWGPKQILKRLRVRLCQHSYVTGAHTLWSVQCRGSRCLLNCLCTIHA